MSAVDHAGRFLGVAVCDYDDEGWRQLLRAGEGVEKLRDLLDERGYETDLLESPTQGDLLAELEATVAARSNGFQGPFVIVWSGHGDLAEDTLGLILRDTPATDPGKGLHSYRAAQLVSFLSESGSRDSLVILDTCFAGAADAEIFLAQLREAEASTTPGQPRRFALVVSCKGYEQTEDGAFLGDLLGVLENGPEEVDVKQDALRWGAGSSEVGLTSLLYVLERRVGGGGAHPRFWSSGVSDITFPNPRYRPDAAPALVDDRLREVHDEPPRPPQLVATAASEHLLRRIASGEPGLWTLTGSPGRGKSSCLRVVERECRSPLVFAPAAVDLEGLAKMVADADPWSAVAIDALNELPEQEQLRFVDIVTGWSATHFVVVSCSKDVPFSSAPWRAAALLARRGAEVVDLDEPGWSEAAIADYVQLRLEEDDVD
jgi:hypothetical protein